MLFPGGLDGKYIPRHIVRLLHVLTLPNQNSQPQEGPSPLPEIKADIRSSALALDELR